MKLKDTVEMMTSEDYKERFKAEYLQLALRIQGLRSMLKKYEKGNLPFNPTCSYELLEGQLKSMERYCYYLKIRAKEENIKLEPEVV